MTWHSLSSRNFSLDRESYKRQKFIIRSTGKSKSDGGIHWQVILKQNRIHQLGIIKENMKHRGIHWQRVLKHTLEEVRRQGFLNSQTVWKNKSVLCCKEFGYRPPEIDCIENWAFNNFFTVKHSEIIWRCGWRGNSPPPPRPLSVLMLSFLPPPSPFPILYEQGGEEAGIATDRGHPDILK